MSSAALSKSVINDLVRVQTIATVAPVKSEDAKTDVTTEKEIDDIIESVASGAGEIWVISRTKWLETSPL